MAANDLRHYAPAVQYTGTEIPQRLRLGVLSLLNRPYAFERKLSRWPDGKFYLVDRGYQHWEHHKVGSNT